MVWHPSGTYRLPKGKLCSSLQEHGIKNLLPLGTHQVATTFREAWQLPKNFP